MQGKKESRNITSRVVRVSIFLVIITFIYLKVRNNPDDFNTLATVLGRRLQPGYLLILLLLMPVNLGLETLKWHYLLNLFTPTRFLAALRGVLCGLALAFITPHGVGDYIGRIVVMEGESNARYTGLILASRFSQMFVTALFGIWGLTVTFDIHWGIIAIGTCLFILIGFALIFFPRYVRFRKIPRLDQALVLLSSLRPMHLLKLVLLSFLRYMVFGFQLAFALYVLADISWTLAAAGTTWIFLAKSVLPSFNFLSDLGIREISALYFFDQYEISPVPVISATLLIWCVNLLLPTLAGALLLFSINKKWHW